MAPRPSRPLQLPRWPAPTASVIFSRMRHRATATSSLRTQTAALAGGCERSSGLKLPRLGAVALLLMASASCSLVEDAAFPNRPIEIVSWATPHSPSDLLSRALADAAPPHFNGQRVTAMTRRRGAGAASMQHMQGRAAEPQSPPRVHG